jgi:protein phosphatase
VTREPDAEKTGSLPAQGAPVEGPEVLLQVASRSDRGLVRGNNEDSFVVADLSGARGTGADTTVGVGRVGPKGVLLAVSDGMGGQEAGEVASRLAVETLHEILQKEWSGRAERDAVAELRNDLRTAVDRANRAVLDHVASNPERHGMGATLTAAVVLGRTLVVAHVGDSRCYLLRDGVLKPLTSDQSLAEELVRRGVVQRDSPAYIARRSVLTRVVGQASPLVPDSEVLDLARGDRLMVCSDGLYGPVDDEVIRDILLDAKDPDEAVEALVAAAKDRGAPDNVTCIAAWLAGEGLPEPSDLDRGGGTMSIRLDARGVAAAAAAAADSTLLTSVQRKDPTAEFSVKQVQEDDTLLGTVAGSAAVAAAKAAAAAPPAGPAAAANPPGAGAAGTAATPAPSPAPSAPAPARTQAPASASTDSAAAVPTPAPTPREPPRDPTSDLIFQDDDGPAGDGLSGRFLVAALVVAALVVAGILLFS